MKRARRVKILSFSRLIVSAVLGLLLPAGYLFVTVQLFGKGPNGLLDVPLRWPFYIWKAILGFPEDDVKVPFLIFAIGGNIVLYGTITYLSLLAIAIVRRRRLLTTAPPQPEPFFVKPASYD